MHLIDIYKPWFYLPHRWIMYFSHTSIIKNSLSKWLENARHIDIIHLSCEEDGISASFFPNNFLTPISKVCEHTILLYSFRILPWLWRFLDLLHPVGRRSENFVWIERLSRDKIGTWKFWIRSVCMMKMKWLHMECASGDVRLDGSRNMFSFHMNPLTLSPLSPLGP